MSVQGKFSSKKAEHLDKVIDELMASGLNDLSLRDLAARVGTSHRMLIYHFGSKEELVNEAVGEIRRREIAIFNDSSYDFQKGSLSESLTGWFERNLSAAWRPYFRLFYEVWGIAQSNPGQYTKFLEGIVSKWVESLSARLVRAGFDDAAAKSRATLLLAVLRGLQLDLFTTHEEERVRQAYLDVVKLIQEESDQMIENKRRDSRNHLDSELSISRND